MRCMGADALASAIRLFGETSPNRVPLSWSFDFFLRKPQTGGPINIDLVSLSGTAVSATAKGVSSSLHRTVRTPPSGRLHRRRVREGPQIGQLSPIMKNKTRRWSNTTIDRNRWIVPALELRI